MRGSEMIPHKMKMKLYPQLSGYGVDSKWDLEMTLFKYLIQNIESKTRDDPY